MKLANNVVALNVTNNMAKTDRRVSLAMGRLSSGTKINRAKDDSAGYAISTRLDMQVQGYTRGSENALDGVSLLQTADGALASVHELLQRCRELAVQSSNDTNTVEDRRLIQEEIDQYKNELDSICKKASYNGIEFLNGQAERTVLSQDSDRVAISLVSDNLDAGTLDYQITSLATHTTFTSSYAGTQTSSKDGIININGSEISITSTDSAADIQSKILLACTDSNLTFDSTTGEFVTKEAGSKFNITISGDATILSDLGLTGSVTAGTDASVTFNDYIKKSDGSSDVSFKPVITADGNTVTMVGQDNKTIIVKLSETNPVTGAAYTAPFSLKDEITDRGQLMLQVGGKMNSVMPMYIPKVNTEALGLTHLNLRTQESSNAAISLLDKAIEKISSSRANIGAYENRLNYTSESLLTANEATQISVSRIRDTDMAKEMANYTKDNVGYQAATSILAQANQRPQIILQLIK